eukprot:PITA_29587
MIQTLDAKITQNEVKEALYAMDPDKAPGPDGFMPRQQVEKNPPQNHPGQSRWIYTRQALGDNFFLVQETIHSSLHRKEKGMVIKLDLANAFDRVRHSFLFDVLQKMGFNPNFIKWIRACISEPWIAPLVNGRAVDFFKASRGLRQGCPLSPLLFVLQASVLSFYLQQKQQDQDIAGL